MPRYNTYQQLDEPPVIVGDQGFGAVNMRISPERVEPGYVAEAINCRFSFGVVETRKGTAFLPWAHKIVSGVTEPWGVIYGVGSYRDPSTNRNFQITAADGQVWAAFENNAAHVIPLPPAVTITGPVTFTQCFNILLMFRGKNLPVLVMENLIVGFQLITQSFEGDGTSPIPNGERGLFFANRLLIPFGDDEVAVSDVLDYTRYVPTLATFKINQGSVDKLVTVVKFNDSTIVAFKEHSILAIVNIVGDLSTTQLDEITNEFGLIGARSTAHVGHDLWFLSQFGVMSLSQTENNKLQGVIKPISEDIDPIIKRINWRYAHNAVACYNDNKYYLAIPIDDGEVLFDELWPNRLSAGLDVIPVIPGQTYRWIRGANESEIINTPNHHFESLDFVANSNEITVYGSMGEPFTGSLKRVLKGVNNTLLVYDLLQQGWSGRDEIPEMDYKDLFVQPVGGRDRMFVVTSTGHVLLYEETVDDWRTVPALDLYTHEIRTYFKTRGYPGEGMRIWASSWLGIDIRTWRPKYSINILYEGINETFPVAIDVTRSRTKYDSVTSADWDETNINDDFDTPKREDYSILLGAAGTLMLHDGVRTDWHQESREVRYMPPHIGKAPQIEVINIQGRIRVLSVALEGRLRYPGAGPNI